MDKELHKKFINQINIELLAFYRYWGIAEYMRGLELYGLGDWFQKQAEEEKEHAQKIITHLQTLGEAVSFKSIENVPTTYANVEEALQSGLKSEEFVSACFQEIYTLAIATKSYRSFSLIQWFIDEQIEEEQKFAELLVKFKQYESEQHLLRIDKFLKNK